MNRPEFEIISHFKLDGEPVQIEQIGCGNINRTFKVTLNNDGKTEDYILQNINVNVFKKPYELMQNIKGVCAHIKEKVASLGGDPDSEAMTFADSDDGTGVYLDGDGKYWRMYRFIEGESYQSITKPGLFYSAAEAFGRFQSMLADYPAKTLFETIPNFHNTISRFADFKAAVENCKIPERLEKAKELIEFYSARESLSKIAVEGIADGSLPLRVTHNDTKLNNVLMHPETDKGLCVIDLDTVMPGSVLYDFGDAIRFGANTTIEDDPDFSKVSLDLALFEEFTRGFIAGTKGALTEKELELLPEGAMLMTFECAIRFLADYLNGDTYFKVNYPEHNFVRAGNQAVLIEDMERKLGDMKKIVKNCIG